MKNRVVIISGFAGSGKTTLARAISEEFRLRYVSASEILRELARELGATEGDSKDWWETEKGMEFVKKRGEDMSFDKELDDRLLSLIGREQSIVVDSKTMGNLSKVGFRIWLGASSENRANRVAGRDNVSSKEVSMKLNDRDEVDKGIYKKLYDFNLGEDFDNFDLILDTDSFGIEDIKEKVIDKIKNYFDFEE
jgi:CMP/dCMP kinase